ncbi:TMM81 protein, partial [Semnornis frantzii]|nr:TMM81 protein [Semnornis frantzii]
MKTLRRSHTAGLLLCAFSLSLVLSLEPITIPAELRTSILKIAVNSTPCSVTCGVGFKLEQVCDVTGAGERRNCTVQRSTCLASMMCGLLHLAVPVGKPLQLSCLPSDVVAAANGAYRYRWSLAPGVITINKLLLKPFHASDPVLSFSSVREADAGTYQCDVQRLKSFQVIKRVYFGVTVIQDDMADLNFDNSLTWEQKVAGNKQEGSPKNSTQEEVQSQKQGKSLVLYWVGLGCGVTGGVILSLVAACLCRMMLR